MGQRTVVVHGATIEGHERVNLRTVESGCQVVQPGRGGKREVMNRIDPPQKILQQTGFDGSLTPAPEKKPCGCGQGSDQQPGKLSRPHGRPAETSQSAVRPAEDLHLALKIIIDDGEIPEVACGIHGKLHLL